MTLVDGHGRSFHYLRLSVEDACDYRCAYCLPHGYHKEEPEPPLSLDEIRRLVAAFAGMGFWKVRLTGGEPTVRKDIVQIARAVARTPGVRRVALSTNGARLSALALELADAGYPGGVYVELSRHSHDAPAAARKALEFLRRIEGSAGQARPLRS